MTLTALMDTDTGRGSMARRDPLGLFVLYRISSGSPDAPLDITRDQLKDWMIENGVGEEYLPPVSRAVDAFRAATTGACDEYVREDGQTATLSLREIKQTKDVVTRQVFLTCWDREQRRQVERRVADLQFFRPRRTAAGRLHGTERLRTLVDRRLFGTDKDRVTALVQHCIAAYEAFQERLSTHALRAVIREFLIGCGGVAVHDSGSGYIVAPQYREQLHAMREVVARCGPACRMRVIPLPEDPEVRDMIIDSVDQDLAARADALCASIDEWVRANSSSAPTTGRWNGWRGEKDALQDWLMMYLDLYEETFPHAADALERAVAKTDEIGRRVVADRKVT